MSRNFELMEQLKDLRSSRRAALAEQQYAEEPIGGLKARSWADGEAIKVVQRIFGSQAGKAPQMAIFAGVDHGSGCSRICASVAEALATNQRSSVCLVEANFRSPSLSAMFGMPNRRGLTDALVTDGAIGSYAQPVGDNKLWLLPSGPVSPDSPNLLTGAAIASRVKELRQGFDFVLIDAPPLTQYADAIVLGQLSDGVVLVLEAEATRRATASKAVENLRASNISILGAVLNKRTFPIPQKIYDRL